MFIIAGNNGIIKIDSRASEINPFQKIIRTEPEYIKCPNLIDSTLSLKKCTICKKKMIMGDWEDFLPLFKVNGSDESIVITNILGEENSVSFCKNCGVFHIPMKEIEFYTGNEKQIKKKISDKALASIVYYKSMKVGGIISGSLTSISVIIYLLYRYFFGPHAQDSPLILIPFIGLFSFLVGMPLGALIGAFIGRARNENEGRPPF